MRLHLTDHAVDRFCQRVRPDLLAWEARRLLEVRLPHATGAGTSLLGHKMLMLDDPPCRLVVRPGRFGERGKLVVITILGAGEVEAPEEIEQDGPAEVDLALALWRLIGTFESAPKHAIVSPELTRALRRLALAIEQRPDLAALPAAPLLRGFEILAAAPLARKKRRKLELIRDGLREIVAGPAGDQEVEGLWGRVIELAREMSAPGTPDRSAWEETAAAWTEGLNLIRRTP